MSMNVADFSKIVQQQYQTAVSQQLNQNTPQWNTEVSIDVPFKVHVVERFDIDMEVTVIMGVFSNKDEAETFAKAKGGWEYEIHEFTLDSEVPVEKQD